MFEKTLIALVLVAGCSKTQPDNRPAAGSGSAAAAPAPKGSGSGSGSGAVAGTGSGSGATAAKPRAKPPAPTKEARAAWRKHVKAGWAKQKAKAWGEAVPEFEAALVAIPDEQRALAELGWSAMNAGDFVKARKADEQVIAVAIDDKVKASAYYNLGQIQDKTGDRAGAVRSYLASLALRPNDTVAQAVAKLGVDPKVEQPWCEAGKQLCECIAEASHGINADDAQCTESPAPAGLKTFHKWTVVGKGWGDNTYAYLFDEANQYVAALEADAEHGHHIETAKIESAEIKTLAGHRVLWLVTSSKDEGTYPMDGDGMEMETLEDTALTVCVLGDGKTPTKCPLREVDLNYKHEIGYMPDDPSADWTTSHPGSLEERELTASLADDGTVTLKLVKGSSDATLQELIGPHKLW